MTEVKPGTPPPWQTAEWAEGCCFDIESVAGQYIGSASFEPDDASMPSHAEAKANARYIVHTANTHPSLIAGLREAREALAGLLAHPGTHHDRCIHWEEVGCDCEFSEITNGARAVIAKLDTLLSQEGGQ